MSTPSTGHHSGPGRGAGPETPRSQGAARRATPEAPRPPAQRTDSRLLPSEPPDHELPALSLPELRTLRRDAQRDEADLSYVRRLLQGRIDILRAELAHRSPSAAGAFEDAEGSVFERLPEILTDAPARHRSSARHVTLGTPYSEKYRLLGRGDARRGRTVGPRRTHRPGAEHRDGLTVRYEQQVSGRRQRLQRTADECSGEITRRYREGEAQVEDLLT